MPEEKSLMAGVTGACSSETTTKRKSITVEECGAKNDGDDDSLLTLSLGPVSGARRTAAAAALPDDCLPVTPTLPAPVRPVNVASAAIDLPPPAAASTHLLASGFAVGLTASVGHGNVGGGSAFLPVAGAHMLTTAPTTLPLLPSHFPSGGGGNGDSAFAAVPVHATPLRGLVPPATSSPPMNAASSAPPKKRRRVINRSNKPDNGNGNKAPSSHQQPPFPWAKPNRVAEHYSLAELAARGIRTVEGEVQCKRCDARTTLSLNVESKFSALREFIALNVQAMDDRAPEEWKDPVLPDCGRCGQRNSLRPVVAAEKERINWVFLLLGQTLGLCTLEQLKHFCAHTNQHRTGAKDRVLYSTYMELCNQLCPGGPFDMAFERRNRARPFA